MTMMTVVMMEVETMAAEEEMTSYNLRGENKVCHHIFLNTYFSILVSLPASSFTNSLFTIMWTYIFFRSV